MIIPLILVAVFIAAAASVGAVAVMFRRSPDDAMADRLEAFARNSPSSVGKATAQESSVLASPLDDMPGMLELTFSRFTNLRVLLDQAGVSISPSHFMFAIVAMGAVGAVVPIVMRLPVFMAPVLGLLLATLPILWLFFKRKRRLAAFATQLPAALELVSRALRAGHSLASGLQLAAEEMSDPLSAEFVRVFEEQNLGVPLDAALTSLTERVPNLDLRFFSTAVILQRQTGGDLSEILDKIGRLVRERFQLHGQIQALTGEGRISGVLLLALPPGIFAVMFQINPDYLMLLFNEPMGRTMLAGALTMQLVGALVIRKIINIKV